MLMSYSWLLMTLTCWLTETKKMLFNLFDIKDLGEASFVLGIKIVRDRTNHVL